MWEDEQLFSVRCERPHNFVSFMERTRIARDVSRQLRERKKQHLTCGLSLRWKIVLLAFLIAAGSASAALFFVPGSKPSSCDEIAAAYSDPVPPFGITMVSLSPSQAVLRWQPPPKVFGVLTGYTIEICDTFAQCDADENVAGCFEHHTSEAWLKFETTVDTPYCVLVIANMQCGVTIISSRAAAHEIRTALFD
ncbi:uncharacterized protein LOC142563992 [Dermacentor variabilis]|uniref:uncharacterized protein LOC142563992 n=1 Tax=Dermacentor variabilis TaxID=34621 RepID=UPI003F5B1B65